MPDKPQEPVSIPPAGGSVQIPEVSVTKEVDDEERVKKELARTMPTKAKLRELAKKNPPLSATFEKDEDPPF